MAATNVVKKTSKTKAAKNGRSDPAKKGKPVYQRILLKLSG